MSAQFSNLCDKFRVLEFEVNEVPPPAPASNYPKQTKRWSDSDPSAIQISNPYVRPGRIDTLELARNMDIHNPNGCSDYGGCLPLSPTCQAPALIVRSSPMWQRFHYAVPRNLPSTLELLKGADERGEAFLRLQKATGMNVGN